MDKIYLVHVYLTEDMVPQEVASISALHLNYR